MKTRPHPAKRLDFLSKEGMFFRWLARRIPPGGKLRGWGTATYVLPSYPPHNSKRGALRRDCCWKCHSVWSESIFKKFNLSFFFAGGWDTEWKWRLYLFLFPPELLHVSLFQPRSPFNQQNSHKCIWSLDPFLVLNKSNLFKKMQIERLWGDN